MSTLMLEAELRTDIGKGASRRLRRLENKVPAILYGGNDEPQAIYLLHNKVMKALETESIYSSVLDLRMNGQVERVILKDLQRHPFKPLIMHMDLQRVSAQDVLIRMVPLHFINEPIAKGVKAGGMVNHTMMQVEVRCQADALPEFIEVDILDLGLNDVLHLSDLKLPKGVELATDPTEGDQNHSVVSINVQKVALIEEPVEEAEAEIAAEKGEESAE